MVRVCVCVWGGGGGGGGSGHCIVTCSLNIEHNIKHRQ